MPGVRVRGGAHLSGTDLPPVDLERKGFAECEIRAERDLPPLVDPPGVYDAQCTGAQIASPFGKRAVFLFFTILGGPVLDLASPLALGGPHHGKALFMKLALGAGKRVRANLGTAYYAAWTVANGAPPRRRDRMPLTTFERVFRLRVETVDRDHLQQQKPILLRYSKVTELLERLA